jgi:uncharacterized caspase-like protein
MHVSALILRVWVSRTAFLLMLMFGGCADESRVALVIGESKYSFWDNLNSSLNDANIIQKQLMFAGFRSEDIVVVQNENSDEIWKSIEKFGRRTQSARVAVFFYSGHGMQLLVRSDDGQQSNAQDFLVPINAPKILDQKVVTPPPQLISINRIIDQMSVATTKLIFIDACREKPKLTLEGFAQIEPLPDNTLIAYGAQAGGTTVDGPSSGYSPFTAALAKHLTDENVDVHQMLNRVLSEFQKKETDVPLHSRPANYSTLTRDLFLAHRHVPN